MIWQKIHDLLSEPAAATATLAVLAFIYLISAALLLGVLGFNRRFDDDSAGEEARHH